MTIHHKRLFIGCAIPHQLTTSWQDLIKQQNDHPGNKEHWVTPQNAHITLNFLGNTPEKKIPDLITALHTCSQQATTFTAKSIKIAHFPGPKGRIIAAHIHLNMTLATLYQQLNVTLEKQDYQRDNKPFIPHITLVRLHNRVETPYPSLSIKNTPPIQINEIILYESQSTGEGSHYLALETFKLQS